MATGRLPFAGASPAETVTNVLEKDPVPANALSPDRPGGLNTLISKLIAKLPDERFSSATALREAIEALQKRETTPFLKRLLGRLTTGY
jgi:serine/threonine protein kinase